MARKLETQGRLRPVRMRTSGATLECRANGVLLVLPEEQLGPYPAVLTDRLAHWARIRPDRTCVAKRQANGEWRRMTYAQVYAHVRSIGQALLNRQVSVEKPVTILSENDIEHFLLMLAGQHVGIPTAHISPVYSLVSRDFGKLRHAIGLLTPGLVFVSDSERYGRAIEAVVSPKPKWWSLTVLFPDEGPLSFRSYWLRSRRRKSTARTNGSDPIPSPKFYSPPGARACPKVSSTRIACCAATSK
jgi:feruloyl-CoA synthase